MGTGSLPGVRRPVRGVDHPPHLAARLKEDRAVPLLPLWAFMACFRVNFILPWPFYGLQKWDTVRSKILKTCFLGRKKWRNSTDGHQEHNSWQYGGKSRSKSPYPLISFFWGGGGLLCEGSSLCATTSSNDGKFKGEDTKRWWDPSQINVRNSLAGTASLLYVQSPQWSAHLTLLVKRNTVWISLV